MSVRKLTSIAALLLFGAVTAAAFGVSRGSPPEDRFDRVSARALGVATSVPARQREVLERAGVGAELALVGRRGDARFFVGASSDGGARCFVAGWGDGAQLQLGTIGCPLSFPSREQPVLDYSSFRQGLHEPYPHIVEFKGFAADGVEAVGVRDRTGRVHWAAVANNVYALDRVPALPVEAVLARDAAGKVVYTREFGGVSPAELYGAP